MLTAYIDFKSAGSLLAIDPTLALADRCGLVVNWRPFSRADRDLPQSGADRTLIANHHRVRAQSQIAIDRKYAQLRGIELDHPKVETATDLALGALSLIEGDRVPFIRAAFAAYWQGHANLNDRDVVSNALTMSGTVLPTDLDHARLAFQAAQAQAEDAGVVEAPAYIIKGQVFIGRQHLPWIEEIARGGELPAPRR